MKRIRPLFAPLLAGILAAALVAGCVTQREVKQIVTDANAAILTRQLDADTDDVISYQGRGPSNAVDKASARIEAFIASHPDQPDTIAALRIRQGMLLLTANEPELARAAFSQANITNLHTPRDRTLKLISTNLIWWMGGASGSAFQGDDANQASNALVVLLTCQSNLTVQAARDPEVEGIRDYVAETRAWIGLRYAGALNRQHAAEAKAAFQDTVTNYVASLGTNTTDRISCGCKCEATNLPPTITLELRRCFRAREVLKYAFEVRRDSFGQEPPQLPAPAAELVQKWE